MSNTAARRPPRRQAAVLGVGAAALLAYAALGDPRRGPLPLLRCPTKHLTGLDCPACGGMRLVHDLARGDLDAAVHDNAFLLVAAPLLGVLWWRGERTAGGGPAGVDAGKARALAVAAMVWMALRNLPGWPLRPSSRP